jgi:hypothetical protein
MPHGFDQLPKTIVSLIGIKKGLSQIQARAIFA